MSLRIDILTLFPEMFPPILGTSIPKRAAEKGLVEYHLTNIRDFATDAHKSVDDKPFGGGPGMVMMCPTIFNAVESAEQQDSRIATRILVGVMNFLYALDAKTGKPIPAFGQDGRIDLRRDLGRETEQQSIALTSPGVIYKDLIIVGGRNPETLPAPPGDVRAYDVRSGRLRWSFHTIPHAGEFGHDTWPQDAWKTSGAANNWAGMVVDQRRGIVFVPTGSAAFDFYGADRVGDDLFANSMIALNAESGQRIWH